MFRPRRPLRRLLAAAVLLAITAGACCCVEPPYANGRDKIPFSVTLTADAPVAVRDIVFARDTLPLNGTAMATLELHEVDPRVRLAITGQADIDQDSAGDGLGAFARPNARGDIVWPLATRLTCPEATCDKTQRLILELTDAAPGESVVVAGELVVGWGFSGPGASPLPGRAVTVSGLEAGEARPASSEASARVVGTLPTLDADHPLVLLPVHLTVEGGDGADAIDFASETRVSLGNVPPDAVDVRMYELRPDPKEFQSVARLLYRPSPLRFAPFLGCQLRDGATCEHDAVLRFAWTGTHASVPLDYEVETIVTSFGPPASDPVVLEVPGVVMLTYSAVGRDGPGPSDDPNARVQVAGISNLEYFEFPTDGRERTIAVPVFGTGMSTNVGIRPGSMKCEAAECAVDFRLDLHHRSERGVELPITMSYRFDVRATSFDSAPFPKDALIWLGPKPTTAP